MLRTKQIVGETCRRHNFCVRSMKTQRNLSLSFINHFQKDTEEKTEQGASSKRGVHWASSMKDLENKDYEGRSPSRLN